MQFDHLATYSDTVRPGITRLVFTERDMEARVYIKGLMTEAGLTVREDIMGNIFGRWEGSDPKAGTIMACPGAISAWQGRQGTALACTLERHCQEPLCGLLQCLQRPATDEYHGNFPGSYAYPGSRRPLLPCRQRSF